MESTWLDKAENNLASDEGTIVDPVIFERLTADLQDQGYTDAEVRSIYAVADGIISQQKLMSVAQLRQVNMVLADRYLEAESDNLIRTVADRKRQAIRMPGVGDTVFARSSGEPGRVTALIGTGSPSYNEAMKEYTNRYGLDKIHAHEDASALYRVVHADNVEDLYYDTELSVDPVVASMPYLSQEKRAEMVDKAILKEALGLWWSLLPESDKQAQFTRAGSDLNILSKLADKYAASTQDDVFAYHPSLSAAYNYVAKKAMVVKSADEIDWPRQNIVTHSKEFICPMCHEPGKKSDMQITSEIDGLVKATLCTDCAEQIERDLEGYSLSDIEEQ